MHWTVHLEGGPQRVNHAAVAVETEIYSFGGYSSSEDYEVTGKIDIYVLNTETLRWFPLLNSSCDDAPFKRYGHTVVAYGRKIYLWGGRNDLSASNILHCFDVDTKTWSLPPVSGIPPLAADGHSACIIKDYMYIFGGFQDDTEEFGQSVHRLNLLTFKWEEVETFGNPPKSRDFHTASVLGNRMYIFGGRSTAEDSMDDGGHKTEVYCDKIMYLDTESNKWYTPQTSGNPPYGRRSHSAAVYKDKLYIIGGFNGLTQNHLNDIHQYDPYKQQWTKIHCHGIGPSPRRRHCTCVVGRELYLFGGSSPRVEGEKVHSRQDYQKLIDHSDLHVLDFSPTLKRLCQVQVIRCGLSIHLLPNYLIQEIKFLSTNNYVTRNNYHSRKDYGVFSFSA